MRGNLRAATWVLFVLPLIWMGCAKDNPTGNDVILNRPGELLARHGFIATGQRVAELQSGGHPVQTCGTCHSSAYGGPVIDRHCPDCHAAQAEHLNHPVILGLDEMCVRCHMPFATLERDSTNQYAADVRTHVLRIRTSLERKGAMFARADGGKIVVVDGGITVDVVCYQCHKDDAGVGGPYSQKDFRTIAEIANGIHGGAAAIAPQEGK